MLVRDVLVWIDTKRWAPIAFGRRWFGFNRSSLNLVQAVDQCDAACAKQAATRLPTVDQCGDFAIKLGQIRVSQSLLPAALCSRREGIVKLSRFGRDGV